MTVPIQNHSGIIFDIDKAIGELQATKQKISEAADVDGTPEQLVEAGQNLGQAVAWLGKAAELLAANLG